MSVRNLQYLMNPSSVVLIGASERPSTVGEVLTRNLLASDPNIEIHLVNPKYTSLSGVHCFPDIAALPKPPDMAVIATPRESVPGLVDELGRKGTRAVVIVSAGFGEGGDAEGRKLHLRLLDAARPHLLRIVGPNCLGILAPPINLNASMAHIMRPIPGNIAFVAQSGAVQTSVLDWAMSRGIGFSHLISLGDMADVDFGDMLDYLSSDFRARAIILYMEAVTNARKFMSAARAAARTKPVIVLKAGRTEEGAVAAARHTGAVAGDDAVCDAAFRRAGMLRVYELPELFDAVETLAMVDRPISGNRLTILTNGGGMGVIAADALNQRGGRLADLSPYVKERLHSLLPAAWSRGNPVDVLSDASAARFAEALKVLLEDDKTDAVLALTCPIAVMSGTDAASMVVSVYKEHSKRHKRPVLFTSWVGGQSAAEARFIFTQNRIPSFRTPTEAVRAFMYMVSHRQNQEMLTQTPPSIPESFSPDVARALEVVEKVLPEHREWLTDTEVRSILSAYGIAVGNKMKTAESTCSGAGTSGLSARPIASSLPGGQLMIGMRDDLLFGPVIIFGPSGGSTEGMKEKAVALPPLNLHLARELISRSGMDHILKRAGCLSQDDPCDVALILVKVSQLVCDIAEIAEIEIDPLLVSPTGVAAINARMRICRTCIPVSERLAIRPYPKELEDTHTLPGGQILSIRPIRPEDEPGFLRMFESLSLEERRMRFLHPMQELSHHQAGRLTQIDYNREMALVLAGEANPETGEQELYGSVRIISDPNNESAEYAILVRKSVAGKGLGKLLMRRIIDYARSQGIKEIFGQVFSDNIPMLRVCEALGFKSNRDQDEPGIILVSLRL